MTALLDEKTLTVDTIVVYETLIVAPVRNPPAVEPLPFQIDVPPPLNPPLPPTSTPHVPTQMPLPLQLKPLPLIAPNPSTLNLVTYTFFDVLVE